MSEKVLAMVLAGGKGTRLLSLTKKTAKPAVSFGAKYRIIDFPLSNCANSDINIVGVLTQYESIALDIYVGNGEKWGLNGVRSKMISLSPRQTEEGSKWYEGTADAISKNIEFIDSFNPDHVLILSGDHIYKTTYKDMIKLHEDSNADATISVIEVPMEEASRFGIMNTDKKDNIVEFQEKPKNPKSNLASMGVYIFKWKTLRRYLKDDAENEKSSHDFGKNIIPAMLEGGRKMKAYRFQGYWRDVGTIASLHEANMDIVNGDPAGLLNNDLSTRIYTEDTYSVPQYVGKEGSIKNSIANQGAVILGTVRDSVVSNDALILDNSVVTKCVVMTGARIGRGAKVHNCIIGPNVVIDDNEEVNLNSDEVKLIA